MTYEDADRHDDGEVQHDGDDVSDLQVLSLRHLDQFSARSQLRYYYFFFAFKIFTMTTQVDQKVANNYPEFIQQKLSAEKKIRAELFAA